jgi:ElaB/YqjD/DUF883 family membrane-anchored ribosome-binding protein
MNHHQSMNEKVEALSAQISETIHDFLDETGPALQQASDRASENIERAGHDMKNRATCAIRDKPLKAVVVAAGVGALTAIVVGWMSRHRS